jgi:hypothetical protein
MYFALSNIKHNGNQYFRGDSVPELTEAQAARLIALGVASEKKPVEEAPESNVSRVLTDEERRANRAGKPEKKKAPKTEDVPATDKAEKGKGGKKPATDKAEKHANPDEL